MTADLLDETTRHIPNKQTQDTQKPLGERERDESNIFSDVKIMNCLLANAWWVFVAFDILFSFKELQITHFEMAVSY